MFKFLKKGIKNAISAISNTLKKKEGEEREEEEVKVEEKEKEREEKNAKKKVEEKKAIKPKKLEVEEEEAGGVEAAGVEERGKKKGFFARIKESFTTVTLSEAEYENIFWELEKTLLENNVALSVIERIHHDLRDEVVRKNVKRGRVREIIENSIKESLQDVLLEPFDITEKVRAKKESYVIVFFGINGSGKTTTIAKIVNMFKTNNISCVLAASDTFRAASIEQLQEHASKLKVELIKHKYGADPAAVAYDAIAHAKAKGVKAVLIDTAGRMHSNVNLMEEMKKICKVAKPDLRIFVGEAITGNDVVEQAREFEEKVGIDAIILTKADVDERGGAAVSASYVTKKPILFLGTGQRYGDLERFNKKKILSMVGFGG